VLVEIEDGRILVRLKQAQPPRHFLIGLLDATQILAETVLIELLVSFCIPETAGVR
jgi:hypothetical protein